MNRKITLIWCGTCLALIPVVSNKFVWYIEGITLALGLLAIGKGILLFFKKPEKEESTPSATTKE